MTKELTPTIVNEWLNQVTGTFLVRDIWAELGIVTPNGRNHLRVILYRMEIDKKVVNLGSGKYRKADNSKHPIDWQAANPDKWIPILLPFDIHTVAKIYPKSIIIVTGGKNQGKTSYLLETIKLNAGTLDMPVDLFNSETGPEQLKERLAPLNFPNPPLFSAYERYDNFADVIEPDHLSIIDYLDFNSELYMVGTEIDNIFRKLTTGVAIIGLQKPPPAEILYKGQKKLIERDLAYGGAFTAKRAVLYISLSYKLLKLVYVKTPMQPKVNPNNMQWSYDFDETGYFSNIKRFYGDNSLL